jgi:hypothetical protein
VGTLLDDEGFEAAFADPFVNAERFRSFRPAAVLRRRWSAT